MQRVQYGRNGTQYEQRPAGQDVARTAPIGREESTGCILCESIDYNNGAVPVPVTSCRTYVGLPLSRPAAAARLKSGNPGNWLTRGGQRNY